ncbi:MAG TPA: ATP-dependent DNA ligase [Acidimicrobiia bacterium]|jgi:ATP-dependent DNA ligase
MPPVEPMLARLVNDLPVGWWYEPKWDGFRSLVFRDGDDARLESRNNRPMARYFPEVATAIKERLPKRCVLDAEIVVANPEDGKLDFFSLQQRLHPAASRVGLLAARTPATLILFDLLAIDNENLLAIPFKHRRARLESILHKATSSIFLTPLTTELDVAKEWFRSFEGAGVDGVIAKHPDSSYQPGKRVMAKLKYDRTADCVVVGYRTHKSSREAVGSLLLAVYSDDASTPQEWQDMFGGLMPVGVAASFPAARRKELFSELAPYVIEMTEHPWAAIEEAAAAYPGSRWNPDKDLSFTPLRPELVAEVRFNQIDGGRLRHPAQFLRWRIDRDPRTCRFEQLEAVSAVRLEDILGR